MKHKKSTLIKSLITWICTGISCVAIMLAALFVPRSSSLPQEVDFTLTTEGGGTVEITRGAKEVYHIGDEVTISATPNDNYKFVAWVDLLNENKNEIISTESTYSFVLERNVSIVGVFYITTDMPIYLHIPTELGELELLYEAKENEKLWLSLEPITRENWTWGGWYLDETYTNELNEENFTAYIDKDPSPTEIHIYAKMTREEVNVNFVFYVVNGEKEVATDVTNPNVGPFYKGTTLELQPATKANDATYAYHFDSYYVDEELTTVYTPITLTNDITVYGKFTRENITTHIVTWEVEGSIVETDNNVVYNGTPEYNGEEPVKAADAQYTYTFKGWKIEGTADSALVDLTTYKVIEDVKFVAVFEGSVNQYTIKFVDFNDNELKSETLNYGDTPTAPEATPNHGGAKEYPGQTNTFYDDEKVYTFTGWNAEIVAVTGDTTYKATYTERSLESYRYTIIAKGGALDGLTLVSGRALELHETIKPKQIKIGGEKYDALYYLDDTLTTEATDAEIRNNLNTTDTIKIYAKLTQVVTPTMAEPLVNINAKLGITLTEAQLPSPSTEGLVALEVLDNTNTPIRAAYKPSATDYVTLKATYDTVDNADNAYIAYKVSDIEGVAYFEVDPCDGESFFTIKIMKAEEVTTPEYSVTEITFGETKYTQTTANFKSKFSDVNKTGMNITPDCGSKVYWDKSGSMVKLGSGSSTVTDTWISFTFESNIKISKVVVTAMTGKDSDKVDMTINDIGEQQVTSTIDDYIYEITESNVVKVGTKTASKAFYISKIQFFYTVA